MNDVTIYYDTILFFNIMLKILDFTNIKKIHIANNTNKMVYNFIHSNMIYLLLERCNNRKCNAII